MRLNMQSRNMQKLEVEGNENNLKKCPYCNVKAFKMVSNALPNTTQGGNKLELWYCIHCHTQKII